MEYFYLDIGPMIRRLRQNPTEFELRDKGIHHRPSSIRFILMGDGNDRIVARCNGIEFPISRDQSAILRAALAAWREVYCRPPIDPDTGRLVTQVGRELARLFGPKAQWRQLISVMFAWFDISAWQRHRRDARPKLRVISSLSEDTTLPAGAPPVPQSTRGKRLSA
jgi:hypothetical protein